MHEAEDRHKCEVKSKLFIIVRDRKSLGGEIQIANPNGLLQIFWDHQLPYLEGILNYLEAHPGSY